MKKSYGFTLIELLIAASIFSIIILSIYSAFQAGILSYRKVDSAFEVYQAARIIFNRMESDLKNSFAYKADDSRFQGANTNNSIEFFSIVDSYKEDKLNTDVCRVKYAWDENNKILKRTCFIGLDALKPEVEREGENLAFNVEEMIFKYARSNNEAKEPPYTWEESWPKKEEEKATFPLAVKITLTLNSTEFTKIISLPVAEKTVSSK